jgi:hypothetical protein
MQHFRLSQRCLWRVLSSGIPCSIVRWMSTDVSDGHIASILKEPVCSKKGAVRLYIDRTVSGRNSLLKKLQICCIIILHFIQKITLYPSSVYYPTLSAKTGFGDWTVYRWYLLSWAQQIIILVLERILSTLMMERYILLKLRLIQDLHDAKSEKKAFFRKHFLKLRFVWLSLQFWKRIYCKPGQIRLQQHWVTGNYRRKCLTFPFGSLRLCAVTSHVWDFSFSPLSWVFWQVTNLGDESVQNGNALLHSMSFLYENLFVGALLAVSKVT